MSWIKKYEDRIFLLKESGWSRNSDKIPKILKGRKVKVQHVYNDMEGEAYLIFQTFDGGETTRWTHLCVLDEEETEYNWNIDIQPLIDSGKLVELTPEKVKIKAVINGKIEIIEVFKHNLPENLQKTDRFKTIK